MSILILQILMNASCFHRVTFMLFATKLMAASFANVSQDSQETEKIVQVNKKIHTKKKNEWTNGQTNNCILSSVFRHNLKNTFIRDL